MSLTTGGRASGATSTRSSPRSKARSRASSIETMPTCPPSSSIRRTGLIRICSFIRIFSWLISLSFYESNPALPSDLWHLSIKNPDYSGSRGHGSRSRSYRPSMSRTRRFPTSDVEPKGGAAFASTRFRLVWGPVRRGLGKSAGWGHPSRRLFSRLFGLCARGRAPSLPAVRAPRTPGHHQPLPDGRSGAPAPYDLDGANDAESPYELNGHLCGQPLNVYRTGTRGRRGLTERPSGYRAGP